MTSSLNDIGTQLEAASVRARTLVEGLTPELVRRRPRQESWSVAECIAHLSLTTDAYLPEVRRAIEEGRRQNLLYSGSSFRMGFTARMLGWWLEPPYRLKSRTPAAFVPGVEDPAAVLPAFLHRQQELLDLLSKADGLALDRLLIASPFAKRMKYSVYDAFRLIAVHERRHLWQAEQAAQKLTSATS